MKRIEYSGKKDEGKYFTVSDESFSQVVKHRWYLHKGGYAITSVKQSDGKWKIIKLHRLLLNFPKGFDIDHKDGDKSNYQLSNLRKATRQQNQFNKRKKSLTSSIYKGISWNKKDRRWIASIGLKGKNIYLGSFLVEVDAAKRYDEVANKYFGEFAKVNSY